MMRPGGPDLLPPHHEMIALQHCAGRKAGKVGACARLGIALRPDHSTRNDGRQMLRLLCVGPELHQDRADVIEALCRQLRRANARQLLRHDDLFVEGGTHAAMLPRPMRCDPAFARELVIPGHQFHRRRACRAPPKRNRKIGFQPCPYVHAEFGFSRRVTTEHGDEISYCGRCDSTPDRGCGQDRFSTQPPGSPSKPHSTLMLAAFTTAVHFASSSASSFSNSAGVPILISAPSVSSRARVSAGARLSRNAALSFWMMSGGVPAGATTPSQNV